MRIGLNLLYMLLGVVGGTETYAAGLIGGLASIDTENEYFIFVNREAQKWHLPESRNITRIVCPVRAVSRARRYIYEQLLFPSLLKKHRVDLLHSLGYVGPLNASCSAIVTVHDLSFMSERHGMSVLKRYVRKYFTVQSAKYAAIVITVSKFSKNLICKELGIHDEKVVVTLEGPRDDHRADSLESPENIRAKYVVTPPYIVAFAGGAIHKNIPRLLQAFFWSVDKYRISWF